MKNLTALLLALVMALALVSCADSGSLIAGNGNVSAADADAGAREADNQISNPWTDCNSLDEAAQFVGFSLTAPDKISNQSICGISAAEETHVIQALYGSEDTDAGTACVRKGLATENGDDISGDCGDYSESTVVEQGGAQITLKGNDGTVSLALWTADGYSFSVSVTDGLSQTDMLALAAQVQ